MGNKVIEKLFELAYTDSMTNVQNRNAYEEKLKKLRKPSSNISRITVIVIDINGMKEINDSYGHFSGDDAIKTVAKALKDTIGTKADIYHHYLHILPRHHIRLPPDYQQSEHTNFHHCHKPIHPPDNGLPPLFSFHSDLLPE